MNLSNPRWMIDGAVATSFVFGRRAQMAVDVTDFAGGDITFSVTKSAPAPPLTTLTVGVQAVGATPTTVQPSVPLAYQWNVLEKLPSTFSLFDLSCRSKRTEPYPTSAWFLADPLHDDLLFPPLQFTVKAPGTSPVTSPTIRRELPRFVPGNKIELLVDGSRVLPRLLEALAAAEHHVHLNWFFFATDEIGSKVAQALKDCRSRGVEVRLLFDQVLTAMPEPFGQGVPPWTFVSGMHELRQAGVRIATSSLFVAPLDNLLTVTDPEYRDRLELQKDYAKRLILTHGGILAGRTLVNVGAAKVMGRLPKLIRDSYQTLNELGTGGIGSPVLLGGCRDHTKLIIVDGTVAFCGGLNCHRYYLYEQPIGPGRDATEEMNAPGATERWLKWHDAFARYEGPAVRDAQRYFIERWAVCSGEYLSRTSPDYFPAPSPVGPVSVKVINNVPGLERDIAAEYLRMFRNSTSKILVENPYVTDDLLATFLCHAAQIRRLPVDLIVPEKYLDFGIARDLMKARWDSLRAAGVKLYAYNSHMNHVKVATADARHSIVSSYNFAKSSADQLFESGIAVDDPAFAAEVEQKLFDVDRPVSSPVTTSAAPDWNVVSKGVMPFLDRIV